VPEDELKWEGEVGAADDVAAEDDEDDVFLSNDTASDMVPMIFMNSFLKEVFSFSFSALSLGDDCLL